MTEETRDLTIDEVTRRYLLVRDEKAQLDKAHKNRMKKYDETLAKLENKLMQMLEQIGAESVRTNHGTPYRSLKESFTVASRDDYLDFIREHDAWELLDARVSKTAAKQFKEEHGDLPAGVNYRAVHTINVRSS